MRTQAQAQFYPEMKLLEGYLSWLYFDTHKPPLATTGIGDMIDAGGKLSTYGRTLPWRKKSGAYASEAEADAEYARLSALGISAKGGYAYRQYASLFLDEPVIEWMFGAKRDAMESDVRRFLPGWDDLRADAQLAAMSMVWNVGQNMFNPKSGAYWPNLSAALKAGDYVRAADNCLVNGKTSERNRRNRKMFLQAARAEIFSADPDELFGSAVSISAANVVNKNPAKPGSHAFWTQAVMRVTGHYTLKLDGLFGPKSLAAFKAATGSATVTRAALQKLADDTEWTLGVTVVG